MPFPPLNDSLAIFMAILAAMALKFCVLCVMGNDEFDVDVDVVVAVVDVANMG